jgi:hypothetical protein
MYGVGEERSLGWGDTSLFTIPPGDTMKQKMEGDVRGARFALVLLHARCCKAYCVVSCT